MKTFIYLVQGKSEFISNFLFLKKRKHADALFLTYDAEMEGAIYYPNSTFAQGRNKLLREAERLKKDYLYYILLDDDVVFEKGDWDQMEATLLDIRPAIGVPVVPRHIQSVFGLGYGKRFIPFLQFQPFQFNDEQFLAFHKDVVRDKLVLPYVEEFDHLSWWCTCKIQQNLIQYFYYPHCIQFNHLRIRNDVHRMYQTGDFKPAMEKWLNAQFKKPMPYPHMLPSRLMVNLRDFKNLLIHPIFYSKVLFNRMYAMYFRATYRSKTRYQISRRKLKKLLKKNSRLFLQFRN